MEVSSDASPLHFHAFRLMCRDRLVNPWHVEQITPAKILLSDAATIGSCSDLIAKHLIQVASLSTKPFVDRRLRVCPAGFNI